MPLFSYMATDRSGQPVEGTVEAANSALAFGKVRALGYEVQRLRETDAPVSETEPPRVSRPSIVWRLAENVIFPAANGIPLVALATFYRQFATLINAGMPMFQALVTVGNQTKNTQLSGIIGEFQTTVQGGGRLSDVMQSRRWAFTDMQIEMIRAAELGGTIEGTLRRLADYLDQEIALRRMISRLTFYPKLVGVCALLILGPKTLLTGGTPAISLLILGSIGKEGYTPAQYLLDAVVIPLFALAVIWLAVAFCRVSLFQSESARIAWERFKCGIPGVGKVSRQFAIARFGRAFATLYAGGMPAAAGNRIAGSASGSRIVARATDEASAAAEQGVPLSQSLRASGEFPDMVVGMMVTGEQTGNVDAMMLKAAEYLEGEAESRAHTYAHIFSTVVYLIVALMIAASIISFYTGFGGAAGGMIGND
jgi:type IV pilus assembly protein PilC